MSFTRISRIARVFIPQFQRKCLLIKDQQNTLIATSLKNSNRRDKNYTTGAVGLLAFTSIFKKDEETPEEKLTEVIKSSILCIQKEEYAKAEQMLHLALRMAQDQNSQPGITYVFDVMANLAMERGQFQKAEKLFVDVMKRLFAEGYSEDNLKILHISSKLAHISQLQGHLEKALQGFTWTLKKIEENFKAMPNDPDVKELLGLTKNWFGQLLIEMSKFEEAKACLLDALDIFNEFHGKANEETITILNNLSVACTYLEDLEGAKIFLEDALRIAKELPEIAETGILKANLGLLYLKEGLLEEARDICSFAWKWGKKRNSSETIEQANYCLEKLKELMDKK